jgi:hypothetical protein
MTEQNKDKGHIVTHPCIAATQDTLNALRAADISGHLDADTHLSPGVYFSVDRVRGNVEITLHPFDDGLLKAELKVTGNPEWLSLSIGLGTGTFNIDDTLGITADLRGVDAFSIRPFIRSARDNETHDTRFEEDLTFGDTPGTSILLHNVTSQDALSYGEAFHTLIMPLPRRDLTLNLHDFRLFHLNASSDLSKPAMRLGGLAI